MVLFLIIVLGGTAFFSARSYKAQAVTVDKAGEKLFLQSGIASEFKSAVTYVWTFAAFGDEQYYRQAMESLDEVLKMEQILREQARDNEIKKIDNIIILTKKYQENFSNQFTPLVRAYFSAVTQGDSMAAATAKEKMGLSARNLVPITDQVVNYLEGAGKENSAIVKNQLMYSVVDADKALVVSVFVSVLALVTGFGMSFVLVRMITKPLSRIMEIANEYKGGDLRRTISVDSVDEMGELADILNEMRENLRLLIIKICSSAEQVAAASEELTASAGETSMASQHIASIVGEVVEGSEKQLNIVEQAMATIRAFSVSIQETVMYSNSVADITDKTSTATSGGLQAIEKAVLQMDSIGQGTGQVGFAVNKLADSSLKIGEIVKMISNIAGQTNLLALNAAIEAARAGEQGRGFAVVADEVRKLAESSQKSAREIVALIQENQSNIQLALDAMEVGKKDVKLGIEVVNAAGQAFAEIASMVTDTSGQMQKISSVIIQVQSGSEQFCESIENIEGISKSISNEVSNASAATEEQLATMTEIASNSGSLAEMAQVLQQTVNKFRL